MQETETQAQEKSMAVLSYEDSYFKNSLLGWFFKFSFFRISWNSETH